MACPEQALVAILASTSALQKRTPTLGQLKFLEREQMVKNTFIEIPSPTDSGARRRRSSVPKDLGSRWSA